VGGQRVDGLFVSRTRVADERIELLLARRFPFVAHGRIAGPTRFDSLEVDNLAGARLAFETLHAAGHRRLAMLNAPRWLNFAREREAGFVDAARLAGLPAPLVLEAAEATEEEGERLATALLDTDDRVSGLFCANDRLALGAMRAARRAGRRIGADLGVVGYDDLPAVRFAEPPLTTIDQSTRLAGRRLAELLVARLADRTAPARMELWQPTLVLRQSHTRGAAPIS
jgi:LacI family transcriptional regulator